MIAMQSIRESKTFKLIADFSVLHWAVTTVPGLVAGVVAAMRGRPLEDVLLYFFVISAAVLVLVYYFDVLWIKWKTSKSSQPSKVHDNNRWGLVVLPVAFLIVVGAWFVANHKRPKVIALQPQIETQPTGSGQPGQTTSPSQPPQAPKTRKKNTPTSIKPSSSSPIPPGQEQSGKDNSQTGPVTTEPCSNVQIGGTGNQATTNCGPPPLTINNDLETRAKIASALRDIYGGV
jgi:hypothetical protein